MFVSPHHVHISVSRWIPDSISSQYILPCFVRLLLAASPFSLRPICYVDGWLVGRLLFAIPIDDTTTCEKKKSMKIRQCELLFLLVDTLAKQTDTQ